MATRLNLFEIERFDEADGVMRVEAIARTPGILTYRKTDGTTRRELVPTALLRGFDSDGMPLAGRLAGIPVTNEHPRTLIRQDAALKQKVQVGSVGDNVRVYSDGRIKVFFDVTDPSTQADIRDGNKDGVSLGYEVGAIEKAGSSEWGHHDAIQSEPFSADHLAVVKYPRAAGARIVRFDAEDDLAWEDIPSDAAKVDSEQPKEKQRMAVIKLDSGVTHDVPDAVAALWDSMHRDAAVLKTDNAKHLDTIAKQITQLDALRTDSTATIAKQDEELKTLREDMSAKEKKMKDMEEEMEEKDDAIEEALGKIDSINAQLESRVDADAVTAMVSDRIDGWMDAIEMLQPGLRKALSDRGLEIKPAMDADEIRLAMAKAAAPDANFDGWSAEEVKGYLKGINRARVDSVQMQPQMDSVTQLSQVLSGAVLSSARPSARSDAQELRLQRIQKEQEQSMTPIGSLGISMLSAK
jgi:Asp-tRNA(Asn)/Glu-tRNA(Gln) amidotransferase C subunit